MGYGLPDYIGTDHAAAAQKEMEAAADQAAKAVHGDVETHQKAWAAKDGAEREQLTATAVAWAARSLGHRVNCPSCGSNALVVGEAVGAAKRTLDGDEITETQEHLPHWFQCIACNLKITGLSRLAAIGLGDRYTKTQTFEAAEYYATDNSYADYEDDNNEPF